MNVSRCSRCGAQRPADRSPCPTCGSGDITIEVDAADDLRLAGEAPHIVQAGPQGRWFSVKAPTGGRSEAVLKDGRVQVVLQGPVDVGERGEPRVRGTLIDALRWQGVEVTWRPGINGRGEDAILTIAGQDVTVQITTAPGAPALWQDVSVGSAGTDVAVAQAARWVHERCAAKAALDDKARTLLAVDAQHFGILASPEIVASYLAQFGEPRAEFGFGAVYIVGPTTSATTRLGAGNW